MPKVKNTVAAAAPVSTASAPSTTSTAPAPSPLTGNRLLRRPEVEALVGLKTSAIYANMKAGLFPRPVKIGKRGVAWRSADIAAFLQNGAAAE